MAKASPGKLRSLELGRFLAASIVAIAHLLLFINARAATPADQLFGGVEAPGALGVQYFFVLSGFVMMSAHYRDFGRWRSVPKFWWRRACRIYPMYWLALAIPIYYLYGMMTPHFSFGLLSLEPLTFPEFISPAWSLRYEIAFYIMFGLCLAPWFGKPLLICWVVAVFCLWGPFASLTHLEAVLFGPAVIQGHFLSFFEMYFFDGLLTGWLFMKFAPGRGVALATLILGVAAFGLSLPLIDWGRAYGSPHVLAFVGLELGATMLGLAWLESHGTLRIARICGFLGALSYPLYLLHSALMLAEDRFISKHLSYGGVWAWFIILFAIMYALSAGATLLFDQPVQRLLRRI